MSVLRIKDETGGWKSISTIKGEKGDSAFDGDVQRVVEQYIDYSVFGRLDLTVADFENGMWGYSSKVVHSKRLRSKILHPVKAGGKVVFTNPSFKIYFGVLNTRDDYSYHGHGSGWVAAGQTDGEYVFPVDGYTTIILETADGSDADLANYDCTVAIFNQNEA